MFKRKTSKHFAFVSEISTKLSLIGQDRTSDQFLLKFLLVLHEIYKGKSEVTNKYVHLMYLKISPCRVLSISQI